MQAKYQSMVDEQIRARGIQNERVLEAMGRVPRHEFVPASLQSLAYEDRPLPIGFDQTISQPYIVAFMTEIIDPQPHQRVLEVGGGSGYQTAVLAELVGEVYSIELLPQLAERARRTLAQLGYRNVHVRQGDGYLGWPDAAPFDAIVVACGAPEVPEPLLDQLKPGGCMIIPVNVAAGEQMLQRFVKHLDGSIVRQNQIPVRFVPLRRAEDVFPN